MSITATELGRLRRVFNELNVFDHAEAVQLVERGGLAERLPALRALLLQVATDGSPDDGADELTAVGCGWRAYYDARYEHAGRWFAAAWQGDGAWRSWAALGLGKVNSDLGHWRDARSWMLLALDQARRENDLYRMAECMGALGEVFLRTGEPRTAFELFANDAALLPPGSGHRNRLENYMAVALGRLGQVDLAVPLLLEGFFTALPRDPVSALYSLASLVAVGVHTRNREVHFRAEQLLAAHGTALDRAGPVADMPRAFLALGTAAWSLPPRAPAAGCQSSATAMRALNRAGELLLPCYPVERAWVVDLGRRFGASDHEPPDWAALLARVAPVPPPPHSPPSVDSWMLNVPLPDGGFHALRRAADGDDPWAGMKWFFV